MSMTGSLMRLDDSSHNNSCSSTTIIKMTKKVRLDTTTSTINYPISNASSSSCSNSTKIRSSECHADEMHEEHDHHSHSNSIMKRYKPHLNRLWSVWYGILVTILQAFLMVQGAHRFLSKSKYSFINHSF